MNIIKTLLDFVERAENERKYAINSAAGLKAALKLFELSLNEAEKQSLDILEKNLENITEDVYSKNKDKFSSATIITYSKRIGKTISDYKEYGSSPSKMASWNPLRRKTLSEGKNNNAKGTKSRSKAIEATLLSSEESDIYRNLPLLEISPSITAFDSAGVFRELSKSEFFIREGYKVTLELPTDLTVKEAERIKKYVDVMVAE